MSPEKTKESVIMNNYFMESLQELNKMFSLSVAAQIKIKERVIRELEEIMNPSPAPNAEA